MLKSLLKACSSLFLAFICLSASSASPTPVIDKPLPAEFSKEAARQIYFAIISNPQIAPLTISPKSVKGSKQEIFLEYFKKYIEPKAREGAIYSAKYAGLKLLLDSGLENSAEEKLKWEKELEEVLEWYGASEADEDVKKHTLQLAKLAEGLSGEMADSAREGAEMVELQMYPESSKSQAQEDNVLSQQIAQIANLLASKDNAIKLRPEYNQVRAKFYSGELSFQEAGDKLEALTLKMGGAIGEELIEQAGDKLQRLAAVRSELAKVKGFPYWAEFAVAKQSRAHAPGLRTADELLKFLYGLLETTKEAGRKIYELEAKKRGMKLADLRPAHQSLLLPPAEELLNGYFPRQNIVSLWRQTMRESGFPKSLIERIFIDPFPRDGKQGHAYMFPARTPYQREDILNGQTLNAVSYPSNSPVWKKAVTAIVQNFSDDNVDSTETMFHEGGHGLDYASHRLGFRSYRSASAAETHSTTMEHFLADYSFIRSAAIKLDGSRPSEEVIRTYIKNRALGDLIGFRGNVAQAIFDIELWQYDYSQPGAQKLWERAIEINAKLRLLSRNVALPADLVRPFGMQMFSTDHYYSGSVRYFGYTLAAVSAGMMAEYLLDTLEAKTGRRSLHKQPAIAILLKPIYEKGLERPFPEAVEQISGKKFAPEEYAKGLIRKVDEALKPDCDGALD